MAKQIAIQRAVRKMSAVLRTNTSAAWKLLWLLAAAGFTSRDAIRKASDDELLAVPGIGPAKLAAIRAQIG